MLHGALAGARLTASDFRVPQLAAVDLTGWSVIEATSRGKHLLLRLAGGAADRRLTLHSHLRMDGAWRAYRPGARWSGGPARPIRVVLGTPDAVAVGYHLHELALVPTGQEAALVGHLGPDLLGPDWDEPEAVRRLCTQPEREIGDALLDQRNLAGIGNIYRAECLYLSGVSPWTRVAHVPDLGAVVRTARRLLLANRDHPWQVTTGVNGRGRQHWVFARSGRPCRACGTAIRSGRQGQPPYDRVTYWCPRCQPP